MKYENPNMFIILIEDENIITTSTPDTLLPGIDIGDGNIDADD